MGSSTTTITINRAREGFFFTAMAVGMTAVVFIGFARTFFLSPWFPEAEPLAAPETIFSVHGVLSSAWMVLLIVQAALIKGGRIRLHRRLGRWGAGIAAAMVPLGIYGAFVAAMRPGGFIGVPMPPLEFLASPVLTILLFGAMVALAIAKRRNGPTHKRLMLLATVSLLNAAIIRIPLPLIASGGELMAFWLADVFILLLATWDLCSLRRLHPATLWGGLLTVVTQPLRLWIGSTQLWLDFAGWAVGVLR